MHKIYRAAIASVAVLIWSLLGGERSPAQTLSQFPQEVADVIRSAEEYCIGEKQRPEYRLDEIVYQVSLSGPGTRDYVVDLRKFRCSDSPPPPYCGVTGFCGFDVFLNPSPGRWVHAMYDGPYGSARGWYTVRRKEQTLLVIQNRCDGGNSLALCAVLYRAWGDSLVQIDKALACLSSGARQRKGPSSKQPKHEGNCGATATDDDYRLCRRLCGQPFTSKRR